MNLKFIRSADNNIKQMTVKQLIVALLAVSALLACLLIWPVGAMKDTAVSSSGAETNHRTETITDERTVAQTFVPQHDYIRSIGILLDRDNDNSYIGDFFLEIIDSAGNRQRQVFSKIYKMNDMSKGYQKLSVNLKVIAGVPYIIQISTAQTQGQPIRLAYRTKSSAGPVENQTLYYAGEEIPDASLACSYTYGTPMGKRQILVYDLFFAALFFVATALLDKLTQKYNGLNEKVTLSAAMRCVATTLLAWVLLFSVYYLFVRKAFGGNSWDFAVYGMALLLIAVIGSYVIWHIQLPERERWSVKNIPVVVRVVSFAVYFSLYAPYFNSGSNYGHYLNGSYMSIAFAIVILSFFTIRQLCNCKTIVLSIIYWCVCGASFLYHIHGLNGEQRILRIWEYVGGWLWAVVILITVCNLCRKQYNRMVIPYIAVIATFFALTWIFRHEKYWPIYMTVCFGLLYMQKREKEQVAQLLRSFCQGAVLSFWYEVIFCLLYRPYHHYVFSRYPMQFSSVALTGLYLFFILIAVLLLTMDKYLTKPGLKDMWFWYVTLGTVSSYLFLSVSRTALLGTIAVAIVLFVLLCAIWFQKNRKRIALIIGTMFLSFCMLVPVVYTLTRCVPAVVDAPVLYPYEEFKDRIYQGEEKDSNRYMNVQSLLELVTGRISVMMGGSSDVDELQETEMAISSEEENISRGNESAGEVTNGRTDIFRMYLKRLNWTGHDSMVITVDDTVYAHAHNTFIQVFYDHGILCGIVFLCLGMFTLVRSVLLVSREKEQGIMMAAPLLFLVGFAAAGMAEWVFQPVIPLGFGVLFMIYPLLSPIKKQSQE